MPALCKSWRHHGSDCQRKRAQQDYRRIQAALRTTTPGALALMVLTLPRPSDAKARTRKACAWAYRTLVNHWRHLCKEITRAYGKPTGKRYRHGELKRRPPRYVATLEAHRDGWPHLNVIVECEPMAALAYPYAHGTPHGAAPAGAPVRSDAERWLRGAAVSAGFGPHATITRLASTDIDSAAGYVTKWEGDCCVPDEAVAEVAKLSQLPLNAPRGTRRLRASVRFLPPAKQTTGEWEGELVDAPCPKPLAECTEAELVAQAEARKRANAERTASLAWLETQLDALARTPHGPDPLPAPSPEECRRQDAQRAALREWMRTPNKSANPCATRRHFFDPHIVNHAARLEFHWQADDAEAREQLEGSS